MLEEMLNYFPDTDERVRSLKYSLDAQLLNPMALGMEGHQRRVAREIQARSFNAPLNIDNRGVYYKCYVPSSVVLGTTADGNAAPPSMISGRLPGLSQYVQLRAYDDSLPVASRLERDTSLQPVAVSDPLLFTMTGTDYPQVLDAEAPIAFPNTISLVLSNLPASAGVVEVILTGMAWPAPVTGNPVGSSETVLIRDEGVAVSGLAYSSLKSVSVRGLAAGAVLQGYLFLAAGNIPDPDRPVVDTEWRGFRFPRYWQLDQALLKDTYTRGRFTGYQIAESYLCDPPVSTIAVEPNTAGMWAASGTSLYYIDRRPAQPSRLSETALMVEPLYGLNVRYDESRPGQARYVRLSPDGYDRAPSTVQYRYLVEIPNTTGDQTWILTPAGALAPYTPYGGWRSGAPVGLSIALSAIGTYLFTLQCTDISGNLTEDVCPYMNAAMLTLAEFDLSTIVPCIQGICFDSLNRMWVWTGAFMVPLLLHYDSFLFDPDQGALYLTDLYDEVQMQ